MIAAAQRNMLLLSRVYSLRQYPAKQHQQLSATIENHPCCRLLVTAVDGKYVAKMRKILKSL